MPVAINVFASRRRMLRALELASWEEWDARLDFFLDPKPPEGILDKLKAIPKVTELAARVSEDRPQRRRARRSSRPATRSISARCPS